MNNLFDMPEPPLRPKKRIPSQRSGSPDNFQTPASALMPLLPYLRLEWHIWEPAAGKGTLVGGLCMAGRRVTGTDILPDEQVGIGVIGGMDFLTDAFGPAVSPVDAIVTNPPFSLKDEFLARCYELNLPFALLLPFTALEGQFRQALYRKHGLEIIFLPRRVNFETPSGKGSGSWFPVMWLTWGLGIGQQLTFSEEAKS